MSRMWFNSCYTGDDIDMNEEMQGSSLSQSPHLMTGGSPSSAQSSTLSELHKKVVITNKDKKEEKYRLVVTSDSMVSRIQDTFGEVPVTFFLLGDDGIEDSYPISQLYEMLPNTGVCEVIVRFQAPAPAPAVVPPSVVTLQFMQKNDLLEEENLWLFSIENHRSVQALKEALRTDMNLFYLPSLWKGGTELEDAWVIATHLFDKDILVYK